MDIGIAVMLGLLFVLLFAGVPVGVCMIFPIFALVAITPITSVEFIIQSLYTGVANYTMLAIPFFILAGDFMNVGGLSRRLVNIANSLVGGITGSLGAVAVLACMFFGAVSGSAPATVAAIGAIMLPEMVRNGYNKFYAIGLITVAGSLGVVVPPSIPLVIYGVTMNVSISDLFISGIIPAFMVGGTLIGINYIHCKKVGLVGTHKFSMREFLAAMKDGWSALLMPVIILGGIYSGVFTVTEASVVATTYSIIVAIGYRELSFKTLFKEFKDTAIFCGGTLLTLAPSAALGQVFVVSGITDAINGFFMGMNSEFLVIVCVFVILFIAGMFIQTTPMICILGPVLLGVLKQTGMTPLEFGIVMDLALSVAFCTPPMAVNLFVASSMTGVSIDRITKPMMPFLIGLIVILLILMFFPGICSILI